MKPIVTHCALRLGDNLAHLHFLRKLAEANPESEFIHFAHAHYLPELFAMISGQPRIGLIPLPINNPIGWLCIPPGKSINAWKNADGYFERTDPQFRNVYSRFMLAFFGMLAGKMGFASPFKCAADLLFDYPALEYQNRPGAEMLDFLIVNAVPMSGQAERYSPAHMDILINQIRQRGFTCLATSGSVRGDDYPNTEKWRWNVTQIGQISQNARRIVMVATGPSWPTFNVWNRRSVELRIIINEPEIVDLDPNALQAHSVIEATEMLHLRGIL